MAHKIMLMSPLHNMGTTCVAIMMAQGITYSNKVSTLLYTDGDSHLPSYLNIPQNTDPTRSIMQIVKLIDNGAIEDKDILDYGYMYSKNCWMINVSDASLLDRDREQVVNHIYSRVTSDIVIVDNSEDIVSPLTHSLLETSDMVYIVVDMSPKCMVRLDQWLKSPQLVDNRHVYIIVNKYDETVYALRTFAKKIGFPANRVCKLHYNPWITKCCTNGQLHTILPLARNLDPRVAALNNDVNEYIQSIGSSILTSSKALQI